MRPTREVVLRSLAAADVRYLIVGGVAVVLHGILRTTLDLDLVLDLEPENVDRALRDLGDLGFEPRAPVPLASFADPTQRASWMREKNMEVFSLWHPEAPAFTIALFLQEPFDFDAAYADRDIVEIGGSEAPLLNVDLLIEMKEQAGRSQDLDDLRRLREVQRRDRGPQAEDK